MDSLASHSLTHACARVRAHCCPRSRKCREPPSPPLSRQPSPSKTGQLSKPQTQKRASPLKKTRHPIPQMTTRAGSLSRLAAERARQMQIHVLKRSTHLCTHIHASIHPHIRARTGNTRPPQVPASRDKNATRTGPLPRAPVPCHAARRETRDTNMYLPIRNIQIYMFRTLID